MPGLSTPRPTVPERVFLVMVDGEPCVDWDWGSPGTGSAEPLLAEFASLAWMTIPDLAGSVSGLVERFGPLSMCADHHTGRFSGGHTDCQVLKPEPLQLWKHHASIARRVLDVAGALERGAESDPYGVLPRPIGDHWFDGLFDRQVLSLTKQQRAEGWSSELFDAAHQIAEEEVEKVRQAVRALEAQRRELKELLPKADNLEGWAAWMRSQVNISLLDFPTRLKLEHAERAATPVIEPTTGLLSRVYLELALEVSGTPRVAFCSECRRPYAFSVRPKRGQDNYCPSCRGSARKKRHMRRKRAAQGD